MLDSIKFRLSNFSSKVDVSQPVKAIREKKRDIAVKVDSVPLPLTATLYCIPVLNIFIHYLKEEGLDERLPELREHHLAKKEWKSLNNKVKQLEHYRATQEAVITQLESVQNETPNPRRAGKLKAYKKAHENIQTKLVATQNKLKDAAETKLELKISLEEKHAAVQRVKNERKWLRYIIRANIIVATALTITFVALSTFSMVCAFLGFAGIVLVAGTLGTHIAICNREKWAFEGRSFLADTKSDPLD